MISGREIAAGAKQVQDMEKAVLFDIDDTLYDQTQPFVRAYGQYFGDRFDIDAEKIFPVTRKYSDQVYGRAMAGEITMEELYVYRVQKAFEEFGISISREETLAFQEVYAGCQKHISMTERMKRILSFCSGRVKVGIITNGPSQHQWNKVRSLQADQWIPEANIFVSADVGAEKPRREIFEYAQKSMQLDGTEVYFVGDSYDSDMAGVMNVGWKGIWMNRRGHRIPEGGRTPDFTVTSEEELEELLHELLAGEKN